VPQDNAEAAKWYRRAAEQGNAQAQSNLGAMYDNGQGVRQDYAEAVKWYRKAADQGEADGQFNLGIMYARGRGIAQDYVQAHKWFNLAAARYPASETENRQEAVRNRDLAASRMNAAQIAEAQRLAREWKPK
jgi:TPR repeat protein